MVAVLVNPDWYSVANSFVVAVLAIQEISSAAPDRRYYQRSVSIVILSISIVGCS